MLMRWARCIYWSK